MPNQPAPPVLHVIVWTVVICLVLSLTITLSGPLSWLQSLRIVFGYAYVLLIPGFAWTYVFLRNQKISFLERGVLSMGLSIAMVPLVLFGFRRTGIPVTALSIFLEVLVVSAIPLLIVWSRTATQEKPKQG